MKRVASTFVVIIVTAILVGCATPANHQAMTVQPVANQLVNSKLKGAVQVGNVTGGSETNPIWKSEVDNTEFKKALQDSLSIAGYSAAADGIAPYSIDAELKELDQPIIGLDCDVKSTVLYTLKGPEVRKKYPVTFTGTASVSDAFIGVVRLRIANERSIAGNIKELLRQLQEF